MGADRHAQTLPAVLEGLLSADPSQPLITFYDDGTGERTELSVASFANWVNKTANLLQDEFGVEPGEYVSLQLPPHWLGGVWVWAAAACGLVLVRDADPDQPPAVLVCGPESLDSGVAVGAGEVVASSLRPLGGRFPEPLPAAVHDFDVEVLGQGDDFVAAFPPSLDDPLLDDGDRTWSHAEVVERARASADTQQLASGVRLMTDLNPADPDDLVDGLLAAMVVGGSVVLVRNADPAQQDGRAEQERVTVKTGDGH